MSDTELVTADDRPAGAVVTSPFGARAPAEDTGGGALVEVASAREIAEVQAAVIMARRFPRDQVQAMDRVIQACTRPSLAQGALYNYSRGGTDITGPSIRLAEVLAQNWGNIKFGWREVERVPGKKDPVTGRMRAGRSTISTYAWDLETNVPVERSFQMIHERNTRSGTYPLVEDRDIYEAAANLASRRMRACILAVIPGDVVETAVDQCEATMLAKADTSPEAVAKLAEAFIQFGVTKDQIEARIQRRLDAIRPAQVVQLRKVWKSLDDGMSVASDWFQAKQAEPGAAPAAEPELKGNEGLKAKLQRPQAARGASTPAADQTPGEAATPASEPGTAAGAPSTGAGTSLPEAMELGLREAAARPREPGEEG
jgi:hypothetical protein